MPGIADTIREAYQKQPVLVIGAIGGTALVVLALFGKKSGTPTAPMPADPGGTYYIYSGGGGAGSGGQPGGTTGTPGINLGGPTPPTPRPPAALCPPGQEWNPTAGRCDMVSKPTPPTQGCPPGYEWDSGQGACVPVRPGRHPFGGGGGGGGVLDTIGAQVQVNQLMARQI